MEGVKSVLKTMLSEAEAVALCVDIWSSKDNRGFLGVSVHFLDQENRIRNYVLGCPRFRGKHDASPILELTTELIDEYGIREKVYNI